MTSEKSKSTFKKWLKRIFLFLLLCVIGVVLYIWYAINQINTPPAVWTSANLVESTPETEKIAGDFERDITAQLSKIREKDDQWEVAFSQYDANLWLESRLRKWLKNQSFNKDIPKELKKVRVHFEKDSAQLMSQVVFEGQEIIVWAKVDVLGDTTGGVKVKVTKVGAGEYSVTPGTALKTLKPLLPEEVMKELPKLFESQVLPPVKLGDGREVKMLNIELEPGQFKTVLKTQQIPKK